MQSPRSIGKSRAAAMMAALTTGMGVIYGGVHIPTHRLFKKPKTSTHPMITASDAEIREWNANVKTRQVLRSRVKPWRYPHRKWRSA